MRGVIKTCDKCGIEFCTLTDKMLCERCRKRAYQLDYRRRVRENNGLPLNGKPRASEPTRPERRDKRTIIEIAVAAKAAGLTYGQYVAREGL